MFDRSRLNIRPLSERQHKLDLSSVRKLVKVETTHPALSEVGRAIARARSRQAAVIMMLGGHVIRAGVQPYLIDLMERGFISCIALNGSGLIHDYELSLIGATTEDVETYLDTGQFGLWRETGAINEIASAAYREKTGLGHMAGRMIEEGDFPHKHASILAAGYRTGVPVTVHVGIGYDIVYEHPNCDGAAWGAASYCDFLRYAKVVEALEGGVVATFGCAVMAPEVFLKSLAMARNVALADGRRVGNFDSLVCDLLPLPNDVSHEPSLDNPAYYFRPWKTLLVRAVSDRGRGHYVRGHHGSTIPELWTSVDQAARKLDS
ncbi:MAG: hypothetical protein IH881_11350 [Myxococcales bacterium]|nr:hypothetical protein [Myxococcales bacterium]